jgi:hypothetical protein
LADGRYVVDVNAKMNHALRDSAWVEISMSGNAGGGPWPLAPGRWSLVPGPWSLVAGRWSLVRQAKPDRPYRMKGSIM